MYTYREENLTSIVIGSAPVFSFARPWARVECGAQRRKTSKVSFKQLGGLGEHFETLKMAYFEYLILFLAIFFQKMH